MQLLADHHGAIVHLGDRDCSTQRRYQKLVEEAPASRARPSELRERLADAAVALGRELDYVGAGTVEFLVDLDRDEFSFLEVNTRVQVEHPVTEMVTGIDIVREQLRIAGGEPLGSPRTTSSISGHAIECRINAESVADGFVPSPGTITRWNPPTGDHVRVDSHVFAGYDVPPYYDSLLAKLIVVGADRAEAIDGVAAGARRVRDRRHRRPRVDLHRAVLSHADFRDDAINTRWLETHAAARPDREHRLRGIDRWLRSRSSTRRSATASRACGGCG